MFSRGVIQPAYKFLLQIFLCWSMQLLILYHPTDSGTLAIVPSNNYSQLINILFPKNARKQKSTKSGKIPMKPKKDKVLAQFWLKNLDTKENGSFVSSVPGSTLIRSHQGSCRIIMTDLK